MTLEEMAQAEMAASGTASRCTVAVARDKPRLRFTRADLVEVTPVPWLIEGWLARDTLAALVAPSGACKTFLATDFFCCVSTGHPWNGCPTQKGAVFVLAGEGRNGLRKRIEGWSQHNGVSIAGAPIFLADSLPRLDEASTADILDVIEGLRDSSGADPALVVIDTVARALAGDENSATDMGRLVECADAIRFKFPGCTVLLVHHSGHGDKGRARGSSAFYAALDSEIVLKPLRTGDIQVLPTKCKDWAPPAPLQFRRQAVSVMVPGLTEATSTLVLAKTNLVRTESRGDDVQQLKASGRTIRQIADETGIPRSTVSRLLKDSKEVPIWEEPLDY